MSLQFHFLQKYYTTTNYKKSIINFKFFIKYRYFILNKVNIYKGL